MVLTFFLGARFFDNLASTSLSAITIISSLFVLSFSFSFFGEIQYSGNFICGFFVFRITFFKMTELFLLFQKWRFLFDGGGKYQFRNPWVLGWAFGPDFSAVIFCKISGFVFKNIGSFLFIRYFALFV